MEEKKIARENRNEEKLSHGDWVMAEFYATWCPHCKRMHPVVKQFKKMMEGILEVVEVDVDQENALAEFYTIESTPTFILMRKGEQLWRQSGELSLEIVGIYEKDVAVFSILPHLFRKEVIPFHTEDTASLGT